MKRSPQVDGLAYKSVRVVYEDEWLLAADKPAPLLVHGDGTGAFTLTDSVREHLAAEGLFEARPQAVNRIDVDTTGLVLFSLRKETQPALDALMAGHETRKRYLAVVAGSFPWEERLVDEPIGRDRHDARRMRVCREGAGKPSRTLVRRLAVSADGRRSLLEAELQSGRRHQIRVHLALLGYPVVGDALYGGARSGAGLLLHAWRLELAHPVSGARLCLQTDWPLRVWPQVPEALARPR